jgi:flagellar motor switch protein FliG
VAEAREEQNKLPDNKPLTALTGKQKAALVIISLGADKASEIYKYLKESEIEDLTYEVAKLGQTTNSQVEGTLDEYYKLCLTHKMVSEGGLEYAKNVLEKAFGEATAKNLLDKISKTLQSRPFNFFGKGDPKAMIALVQHERPQVVALILSYLDADLAATVVMNLPEDRRRETVSAMAQMDRVSPEAIKIVEDEMRRKYEVIATSDQNQQVGGVDFAADVMNHMDRTTSNRIFEEMDKTTPDLAADIRDRMFVFEDILKMDDRSVQRFIRDCDTKDIVFALKNANQDMSDIFFRNMSKRMADTVRSDMEVAQHVRLKDVEEAQQHIVNLIRKLEAQGEVIISKGGGDDEIIV